MKIVPILIKGNTCK